MNSDGAALIDRIVFCSFPHVLFPHRIFMTGVLTSCRTKFVMSLIRKSELLDSGETLYVLLGFIAASLNAMSEGRTPSVGPNGYFVLHGGQKLLGGVRVCSFQLRGDWQRLCQALGFPQWNLGVRMCFLCNASNCIPEYYWRNCAPDAPWLSSFVHS